MSGERDVPSVMDKVLKRAQDIKGSIQSFDFQRPEWYVAPRAPSRAAPRRLCAFS